jgi:hypothetical protein
MQIGVVVESISGLGASVLFSNVHGTYHYEVATRRQQSSLSAMLW